MNNNRKIFALALGFSTLLSPAFAQSTANQGSTGQGTSSQGTSAQAGAMSSQDQKFVMDAAQSSMMEIETGRLAAQKAANADVKAFGQRMVTDHTQASNRLMQTVANKNVTLPKELKADHRQHVDQLAKLSGAEFDRMYLSQMVKAHDKDVAEFEKQSKNGSDPGVRSFATQTLPTLREHQKMVRELATKNGVQVSNDHSAHGSGKSGS
jgi:putative membrane protein